ncbi:MAG: phospholipase [Opitutia bacterium Tous-C1TDCM]|nr:MAG: phospholipase [Opitutae bacterium Tous-C1TDCM]
MPRLSYQHVFEPGTDPSAPPLLLLHGTGGNEHDLLRLGRTASPGSALLSPRGDVVEGQGVLRFFARLGEGVFDPAEITRRTHALADFVLAAAVRYGLQPLQLMAVGFSNGANIAATMLLLRPDALGGGVLLRSMLVLDQPALPGSLAGRRVLLLNGTTDPLVSPDDPARLAALLRAGGADVKTEIIPASHQLTPQDVAAAQRFLRP